MFITIFIFVFLTSFKCLQKVLLLQNRKLIPHLLNVCAARYHWILQCFSGQNFLKNCWLTNNIMPYNSDLHSLASLLALFCYFKNIFVLLDFSVKRLVIVMMFSCLGFWVTWVTWCILTRRCSVWIRRLQWKPCWITSVDWSEMSRRPLLIAGLTFVACSGNWKAPKNCWTAGYL